MKRLAKNKGGVTWIGVPLGLLLCLLMSGAPAGAAEKMNPVDIKEWEVPYGGRPRDLSLAKTSYGKR